MTLARHTAHRAPTPAAMMPAGAVCAVSLIDRRTGSALRLNGGPVVLLTRQPHEAAAELLAGRNPAVWEARIEPLGHPPQGRRAR